MQLASSIGNASGKRLRTYPLNDMRRLLCQFYAVKQENSY